MLDETQDSIDLEDLSLVIGGDSQGLWDGVEASQQSSSGVLQPLHHNNVHTNAIIPTHDDVIICNQKLLPLLENSPYYHGGL